LYFTKVSFLRLKPIILEGRLFLSQPLGMLFTFSAEKVKNLLATKQESYADEKKWQ